LDHEVTVFTLGHGTQDEKDVVSLRSKVARVVYQEQPLWYSLWNSLKAVPSRRPLQTVYSWNPMLARELVSLLGVSGTFDLVHVEHLRGSLYGQYIKSKLHNFPVVWDSVDCISYLFKQASAHSTDAFGRIVTRFELGRTRLMEGILVGEFAQVFVASETDRNALLELALPGSKPALISVLSNGVDLSFFHPNPDVQRDTETLVFSGKMSYHANISMVKFLVAEILPQIWMIRPNVRLVIVGKDPVAEVRALGANPRIEVTGTVDDIRPYLWKATIAVVPLLYGAGIQNKILEAMACGIPVVTTSKVLSSIKATPGRELMIADGVNEFSQAVLNLLDDPEKQFEIGVEGSDYVQHHHSWTIIAKQLLVRYSEAMNSR
jgi:glycosyltransferase involved in cell wall biosynthesis